MPELKMIAPLLSNMEPVSCISERSGTCVYIVKSTKSSQTYILKHISVPESQKQVDALIFTGAAKDAEEAQQYYKQVAADYQQELETLETLSACPNLGCFRSYQIEPKEDGVGYDVYLLAEHRRTLSEILQDSPMTRLSAVNLGLDLCNALSDLRQHGLLHRDVKPSNIYLSSQGHFVVGDLGIAKLEDLRYCSMPEAMLSSYSAPELFSLVGNIHPTTDLYSAGLILYRIFNGNHGPFEDESTGPKAADKRRVTGEQLPPPMYADYELTEILQKACAFEPEARYQTPEELREALLAYAQRNEVDDSLIVPPIVRDEEPVDLTEEPEAVEPVNFTDSEALPDDFRESFSPDVDMLNSIIESVHRDMAGTPMDNLPESDEPIDSESEGSDEDTGSLPGYGHKRSRKRRRVWPFVVLALLLLAAAAAAIYFFVLPGKTVEVDGITLVEKGTDYLTVRVNSDADDGALRVLCADAYGNTLRQNYLSGADNTFINLQTGSQYSFSVEPASEAKIVGSASLMASTLSVTRVLSFTVQPASLTEATASIVLDGPDPGQWNIRCTAEGLEPRIISVTGGLTSIPNLRTGYVYTFELLAPEGVLLTGETVAKASTVPSTDLVGNITAAISNKAAILSWKYEGDDPGSWSINVSGSDGFTASYQSETPQVTLEDLTPGVEYTILISAPTMLDVYSTTIAPTATKLQELNVAPNADGSVRVYWACDTEPEHPIWTISCTLKELEIENSTLTFMAEGNEFTIPAGSLLPGVQYSLELMLQNGERLDDSYAVVFTSPAADRFQKYDFSGVYVGLFLEPDTENWTYLNLAKTRTTFSVGEKGAFCMQSLNTLAASTDNVRILLLLKDEDGHILSYSQYDMIWNDMWHNSMFVGAIPEMPQEAGTYPLEFYFNGQLATRKNILID